MSEGPVVSVQENGEVGDEIRTVPAERAVEWFKAGWQVFRAAPGIWALIALALVLLNVVIGLLPPFLGAGAAAVLMPLFGGGLMAACAAQERGEEVRFEYLYLGFRVNTHALATTGGLLLAGFLASVVVTLAVGGIGALLGGLGNTGIGAVLALGSLLLASLVMVATLVALGMAAWFAPALVALARREPKDALRTSFRACLRNWLPLLIHGLLTWVFLALSLLTLGLGFLVLIPVLAGSIYRSYREILN